MDSVHVAMVPTLRTTSLEHACVLRWMQIKIYPHKKQHLKWTLENCPPLFTNIDIRWNDLSIGTNKGDIHCVIEVPKGSIKKYELDREFIDTPIGDIKANRLLPMPMVANYGFIPQTYVSNDAQWNGKSGDGDPLDCIVHGPRLNVGTIVNVSVLGVLEFYDDDKMDFKIITRY